MKEQPLPFDPKPILEEILRRFGSLHPVARRPSVVEARRLWRVLGILEPPPTVQEKRPRVLAERLKRQRRRAER